jgi:hypothetical protein
MACAKGNSGLEMENRSGATGAFPLTELKPSEFPDGSDSPEEKLMFRRPSIATAISIASLAIAGPAVASGGHSCKVNGGAAGCSPATNLYTGSIAAADGAGNMVAVAPTGSITCTTATFSGFLSASGSPPPGTGPSGYVSAASFSSPTTSGYCTTTLVPYGNPYAQITPIDTNAGLPGVWNLEGDWNSGFPTLQIGIGIQVTLRSTTSPNPILATCLYSGSSTGSYANAGGFLTFTSVGLSPLAGASCPSHLSLSAMYGLSGGGAPLYLTA